MARFLFEFAWCNKEGHPIDVTRVEFDTIEGEFASQFVKGCFNPDVEMSAFNATTVFVSVKEL